MKPGPVSWGLIWVCLVRLYRFFLGARYPFLSSRHRHLSWRVFIFHTNQHEVLTCRRIGGNPTKRHLFFGFCGLVSESLGRRQGWLYMPNGVYAVTLQPNRGDPVLGLLFSEGPLFRLVSRENQNGALFTLVEKGTKRPSAIATSGFGCQLSFLWVDVLKGDERRCRPSKGHVLTHPWMIYGRPIEEWIIWLLIPDLLLAYSWRNRFFIGNTLLS